jgi:medium-chain acyl-[acyl-carrier-protein] hydrolase
MTGWFDPGREPRSGAPLLITFPFAGGGAGFYRSWRRALEGVCEVWAAQLPGRETRIREAPRSELEPLVRELVDALPPLDRPFVLCGHSLGASLAFSVALELRRRGERAPSRLYLCGSPAPHLRDLSDPVHVLDDRALAERLLTYNGTPPALLESRELLDLLLPTIRADFALFETWNVPVEAPLAVPFTVLGGVSDETVTASQIEGWREWTTRGCDVRWLPGDHFFIASAGAAVIAVVREALERSGVETVVAV